MSLAQDLNSISDSDKELSRLTGRHEALKVEKRRVTAQLARAEAELQEAQKTIDLLTAIDEASLSVPKWTDPARPKKGTALACLMLSDTHFDEVVNPDEIEGLNAYDREIAELRLKRTFEKSVSLYRDFTSGLEAQGVVVFLGGDMVSGFIHEELAQTNEGTMPETVLHWSEQLCSGIALLVEFYGKVHVAGVVGNHGRNTRKPRSKGRVRDNWDWLIYKLIEREFRRDDRVTFQIPDSADCTVDVMGTRFRLTHGDQFSGGNGIAGIWSPVLKGDSRKRQLAMASDNDYDVLLLGHFHQKKIDNAVMVNGSTKGFDEYAYTNNFGFEKPQQLWWLVTPENGIMFPTGIVCQDRKAEKW